MKKVFLKALLSIAICSAMVALAVSGVFFIVGYQIYENEAKEKLIGTVDSKTREFNLLLTDSESIVNTLASETGELFRYKDYPQYSEDFKQSRKIIDRTIEKILNENTDLAGLFFSFNPELYEGREEIWYVWNDENKVEKLDVSEVAGSWFLKGNPAVDYYFKTIEHGFYWTGNTWEPDLHNDQGAYTSTYGRAVYDDDGILIGVAGADIYVDHLIRALQNISAGEAGIVVLYDSNFQYVASNVEEENLPFTQEEMKRDIISNQKKAAAFDYVDSEGKEYIGAFSFFSNGWLPVIIEPKSVVLEPFFNLKNIFYIVMIFTATAIIIYICIFSITIVRNALKADEAKNIMLLSQSRQAKVGEMVGNISHQFKQPLNLINITLSNIKYCCREGGETDSGEILEGVKKIQECIRMVSETMDDFSNFLKPDASMTDFNILKEIRKAVGFLEDNIRIHSIRLDIDCPEDLIINGYCNEFCQCMINLLGNSCDCVSELPLKGRKVTVKAWREPGKNLVYIMVGNGGGPLSKEVLSRIFDPYFTTKSDKGGTGMGVYLTKQIIEQHFQGSICYKNNAETDDVECFIEIPMNQEAV